ncbi:hypothetical protein BKI52_13425 [marine bacterium AO1-C]|nr:hypothetical protein BKI52_13425 [marine bacterium AO1-C]
MKKISVEHYTQLAEREVWNEMIAKENIAMNRSDLSEIQQVMNVMMHRIKFNLQYIYNALQQYDFKFSDFAESSEQTTPLVFEQNDITRQLFTLEEKYAEYGFFPLTMLELYKHIQQVDFRGFFPTRKCNVFLDALMIVPVRELIAHDGYHEGYGVYIAPEAGFKENVSSNGVYGIELTANQQIDSKFQGFFDDPDAEQPEEILLLDYLRLCFKWAGFPGLEFANRNEVDDYIWDVVSNIVPYLKPI